MRKGEFCENCAAWAPTGMTPAEDAPTQGQCRRHAPSGNRFADVGALLPMTLSFGWCYEWVPQPTGIPTTADAPLPAILQFRYRNHRGEEGVRLVEPLRLYYGTCTWHGPDVQLLLDARTPEGELRTFAIRDVLTWEVPNAV